MIRDENTYEFDNGLCISCLCGKHKPDSRCEVYLRNQGIFMSNQKLDEFEGTDYEDYEFLENGN